MDAREKARKKAAFKSKLRDKEKKETQGQKKTVVDLGYVAGVVGKLTSDHEKLLANHTALIEDHNKLLQAYQRMHEANQQQHAHNSAVMELFELRITAFMRVLHNLRTSDDLDRDLPLIQTADGSALFAPPDTYVHEYAALLGWQALVGLFKELEKKELVKQIREQANKEKNSVLVAPTPAEILTVSGNQENSGYVEVEYKPGTNIPSELVLLEHADASSAKTKVYTRPKR